MSKVSYAAQSGEAQVRELLVQAGMSQRGAARELEISERMMRYYCSGEQPVPKVIILALERLVDMRRMAKDGA